MNTPTALHLACPHCHALNRVPASRLTDGPNCGQCHQPLLTGQPLELTVDHAERHISRNDIPVVVDFWAPWCGPCQMMGPAFAQAAAAMPQVRFAKINTQNETTLGQRFAIRSIPTMILFVGGREIARQAGAMDSASIQRWIAAGLQKAGR
ncbi:thioredoxin TrxC [Vogesella fluminis]|uniref:Thioredoxin n=1 Tax=Vogesella fluminis TaxID=1069161 RepID=A0ABQ3HDL8_9NEIS|nr:thioredoxin TrxC [Vogesella fluminis]GHD80424.1 thiol reductase thioredoxin [Vogesella fluminis]